MPIADIQDTRMHYTLDGADAAKPVIVLLNSLGTTLAMWAPQIDDLTRHFRVLRYDMRGHGGSAVPDQPCTLPQLARDVVGLLDHLNIASAHICGLSLGGMVALQLAGDHPDRVRKAMACNTSGHTAAPEFWAARIALVERDGTRAISEGVMQRFFSPSFSERHPETVAAFRRGLDETSAKGYAACCAAIRDMDLRAALPGIRVPVRVLAGARDQAATPTQGRLIADAIPGASFVAIDAAHMSSVEAPQAFTAAVLSFLLN